MKLSTKVEAIAQQLYDVRDEIVASDSETWRMVNLFAKQASTLALVLQKRQQ